MDPKWLNRVWKCFFVNFKIGERRLYKYVNVTSPAWLDTLFSLNDQGRDTSSLESFWQFKDWGIWKKLKYQRCLWCRRLLKNLIILWYKRWLYTNYRQDSFIYIRILQIWGDWGVWGVWGDLSLSIWWDVMVMRVLIMCYLRWLSWLESGRLMRWLVVTVFNYVLSEVSEVSEMT